MPRSNFWNAPPNYTIHNKTKTPKPQGGNHTPTCQEVTFGMPSCNKSTSSCPRICLDLVWISEIEQTHHLQIVLYIAVYTGGASWARKRHGLPEGHILAWKHTTKIKVQDKTEQGYIMQIWMPQRVRQDSTNINICMYIYMCKVWKTICCRIEQRAYLATKLYTEV